MNEQRSLPADVTGGYVDAAAVQTESWRVAHAGLLALRGLDPRDTGTLITSIDTEGVQEISTQPDSGTIPPEVAKVYADLGEGDRHLRVRLYPADTGFEVELLRYQRDHQQPVRGITLSTSPDAGSMQTGSLVVPFFPSPHGGQLRVLPQFIRVYEAYKVIATGENLVRGEILVAAAVWTTKRVQAQMKPR